MGMLDFLFGGPDAVQSWMAARDAQAAGLPAPVGAPVAPAASADLSSFRALSPWLTQGAPGASFEAIDAKAPPRMWTPEAKAATDLPMSLGYSPGMGAPAAAMAPLPPPIEVGALPAARAGTEDASLPAAATPASGPAPFSLSGGAPAAAAAPAAAPAVPQGSLLDRIGQSINDNSGLLLALGAGFAGAPNLGAGMSRGFQLASTAGDADRKRVAQNQTARFLVSKGVPEDAALGIASNPAILQQMLPQLVGAKQRTFTQIGEDMLGNKRFGFVDPVSNKVYDLSGNEISGNAGAGGAAGGVGMGGIPTSPTTGQPMQGQELLAYLEKADPVAAAGVKGLIAGDINAGRNLQKLLPLASLIEPGFTQQDYQTRLSTRREFTSGKAATQINAMNTVLGHMNTLSEAVDKLGNTDYPLVNKGANFLAENVGGPFAERQAKLRQFEATRKSVVDELTRVWRGSGGSEGDIQSWQRAISTADSPQALHGVIGNIAELITSKINAMQDQYTQGMGSAGAGIRLLTPQNQQLMQVLERRAAGTAPAAAPVAAPAPAAPAAVPPPGNYVFDPVRGLVPR